MVDTGKSAGSLSGCTSATLCQPDTLAAECLDTAVGDATAARLSHVVPSLADLLATPALGDKRGPAGVLASADWFQMLGVDTVPHPAQVVDHEIVGNGSDERLVYDPVSQQFSHLAPRGQRRGRDNPVPVPSKARKQPALSVILSDPREHPFMRRGHMLRHVSTVTEGCESVG